MFPVFMLLYYCTLVIGANQRMVNDIDYSLFVQLVTNCSVSLNLSFVPVFSKNEGNIVLYNGTLEARDEQERNLFDCLDNADVWLHMVDSYESLYSSTEYLTAQADVDDYIGRVGMPQVYIVNDLTEKQTVSKCTSHIPAKLQWSYRGLCV